MDQPDFQPTAASLAQVENERLATEVLAALATDPATLHLELGARAAEGSVRLVGPQLPERERAAALAVAGAIPGVRDIGYEPGYEPAFQYAS